MLKLALIFWLSSSSIAANLQACASVSNYYSQNLDGISFSAFSIFSFQELQGKHTVTISNMNVSGFEGQKFQQICVGAQTLIPSCSSELPQTVTMPLENSTFQIYAFFNDYANSYNLGYGVFDEGYFAYASGDFFTPEQPCQNWNEISDGVTLINMTSCCTSFFAPSHIPENPSAPKCQKFKSRSTIYNVDDNYSIFASSQTNFSYSDHTLFANVSFSAPADWSIQLAGNLDNDCQTSNSGFTQCSFDGPKSDEGKILLHMQTFDFQNGAPSFFVGRIIFRDGQTLMEEGIPFTPKKDCFFHSDQITSSQVVVSSLCCSEFA